MIGIKDTANLISAAEQIKAPASFLSDTFFPETPPVSLAPSVLIEYRKRGRERLAPYIVEGSRGVEVARPGSHFQLYSPPLIAPKRILSQSDIQQRAFGEMPIFSTISAAERAARIQADDLFDLKSMIVNRKNQMAAQLLSTGKITIDGYADDALLRRIDEVTFDWDGDFTSKINTSWSSSNAKIFDDLQAMSEEIQESVGMVPSLMVVGKNVPKYLRANKDIMSWLMIPNRQNLSLMSFEPRYLSPQVQYVGEINALGLTVVSYAETYTADDGSLAPFLDPDGVIVGVPGRGQCLHAAVNMIDDSESGFQTYAATLVPSYHASKESNTMSLTLFSRFILVPKWTGDWCYAKVT